MSSSFPPERDTARPRQRPGVWACAAVMAAAGFLCAAAPARADGMRFCVDRANPLFAVDEAVARAAAAERNEAAILVVRDSSTDDEDEDSGRDQQRFFAKLSKSCDLIMGFPVEANYENLPDGMGATRPYADTGFVTVSTGAAIPSFERMVASEKIGVVFLTVASTYFTERTMAAEHVYYTNDDLYGALLSGEVNSALIWQPWLVRELAAHPRTLAVAKLDMPHADWKIVALYPRDRADGGAVNKFNAGLSALAANGRLREIVRPYKIPTTNQ